MSFTGKTADYPLSQITELWMFVAFDERDQSEGVCSYEASGMVVPMLAADERRLSQLRPVAAVLARQTGTKIKLVKLSSREEVEEYLP